MTLPRYLDWWSPSHSPEARPIPMPLPSQRLSRGGVDDPGTFSILAVCTGNLCRSPTLEQLLRRRLPEALPGVSLNVASAGTHAFPGQPMDPGAVREVTRLGMPEVGGHRAQRLSEGQVRKADLVLGLGREHRGAAVRLAPAANGRSFTLLEFVHLVDALTLGEVAATTSTARAPGARLRWTVEAAHRSRGQVMAHTRMELDVVDPHRREPAVHRASAQAIDAAVTRLLGVWTRLCGPER